jgi:hypothetical protein
MAESLFRRKTEEKQAPLTPHELIAHEVDHLKKRTTARHGNKPHRKYSIWLLVLVICALAGLWALDPIEHAWYRGDAISAYLYLHNYGAGKDADQLAACGILAPEEIGELNRRHGSYQDTYATPQAAARTAQTIVAYTNSVKQLHAGAYLNLDPVGRVRYYLFIRPGIYLPTSWNFLDPSLGD